VWSFITKEPASTAMLAPFDGCLAGKSVFYKISEIIASLDALRLNNKNSSAGVYPENRIKQFAHFHRSFAQKE
jgi:hypothetical protein